MKRLLLLILAIMVSGTAFAAKPTVAVTSVEQRTDSRRTLKIDYALANGPAIVTCEFFTNAVGFAEVSLGRIEGLSGDVNKLVDTASGTITWPVRDYFDDVEFPAGLFRVKLTAWPLSAPPPWCVVDPGESNAVAYYADETLIPLGGLTNALYKTRYIPMRRIDAAAVEWTMGMSVPETRSFPDRYANAPAHAVVLTADYYMSVYTFTRGQYKALNGGIPASSGHIAWTSVNEDELPFANESFSTMRGLVKRWPADGHEVDSGSVLQRLRARTGLAFDLPTEAQWEFACRAGTRSELNNGLPATAANADGIAWTYNNSLDATINARRHHRVGQLAPNAWGLHDMHGNVWEVCLDRHSGANDAAYWTSDAGYRAGSDVLVDPVGPATGATVVMRGGSFNNGAEDCRSARRYWIPSGGNDVSKDGGDVARGYRLVCPIPISAE